MTTEACHTFTDLNTSYVAEYGPMEPGEGYTACVYCGAPEVCCGSPHDDCHCPQCHAHERRMNDDAGWTDEELDCDVPPEADGDSEDPMVSPYARLALSL